MRKQILSGLVRTMILALVVAFLLVFAIIDHIYRDTAQKELVGLLGMFSVGYDGMEEEGTAKAYLEENARQMAAMEIQDIRLTLIGADGTVLADSEAESTDLDNHRERPEVAAALRGERGLDTRRSVTTGENYMYAAVYQNGMVFRTALNLTSVYRVRGWILLSCVVGLLVGSGFAYLISRRIAKRIAEPVDDLILAATNMSGGNLYHRVAPGFGELGVLGESFNQMADALVSVIYTQHEKEAELDAILDSMGDGVVAVDRKGVILLANHHAPELLKNEAMKAGEKLSRGSTALRIEGLLRDAMEGKEGTTTITADTTPETVLDVTTNPLRMEGRVIGAVSVIHDMTYRLRLETMRSDFVANVTHELKTPLTSIRGYVELLKSGDRDEETKQGFYDIIDIEAERLHALIEDLLQLSEIENSKDDPRHMVTNLATQVQELSDRFYNQAESRNISIVLDAEDLMLPMNPIRLRQLLTNLLDNAIKYTNEGGRVELQAKQEGTNGIIVVKDTGIGIPSSLVDRVFERFYRVDKSRSRAMGGTGLGLSIVKHIVQMYEGSIRVESEEEKGTTFTVSIPL